MHVLSLPKLLERHVTFMHNGQEVGRNLLLVEGDRKSGLSAMAVLEMHNFLEWQAPNLSLRAAKKLFLSILNGSNLRTPSRP